MKSLVSLAAVALLLQNVMGDSTQVTKASNTFSNSLYEKVAQKPGNVLVCPISLHVALGLVLQGSGSQTSTELASVLGFSGVNADIKDGYKSLLTGVKDNTLKIATKLYPSTNFKLSSSYVDLARQYFLSDVEGADYSKPTEAANKINKYVEEHTNNKIHDLISPDSISDLTRLIIINAVHFQAPWKKTFTTAYDDYFKVSPGEKVLTKMMSMTDFFHYKEDPALDAKVLKMDYTGGDYSMLFVLPNKEDGLPALESKLVHTDLEKLLDGLHEAKVEVTIPKFKIEKTIELKDILIKMGIKDMFSSRADLSGIANGDNLYVSDVIQKTFINVHENGTEAAAATGYYLEVLSASTGTSVFSARQPFHFTLVRNKRPRMRLFDGRLDRPIHDAEPQQDPNRFYLNNIEDTIMFNEDSSENDKPIVINSQQAIDKNFRPNLFNHKVTTDQETNYPKQPQNPITNNHNINNLSQTAHSTTQREEQSTESNNRFINKEYIEKKPTYQLYNPITNKQNTNNVPQTPVSTTQSYQESTESNNRFKNREKIWQNPNYPVHNPIVTKQNTNNAPQTQYVTVPNNGEDSDTFNNQRRNTLQFYKDLQFNREYYQTPKYRPFQQVYIPGYRPRTLTGASYYK